MTDPAKIKERPILFTPVMAAAVHAGTKTQTRRVVKPQPVPHAKAEPSDVVMLGGVLHKVRESGGRDKRTAGMMNAHDWNPYGVPGDRLYVRESIRYQIDERPDVGLLDCIEYRDGTMMKPDGLDEDTGHWFDAKCESNREAQAWTPNIHMPRWACRSVLEVASVRVERVRDIGKDGRKAHDVLAEGITRDQIDHMQKFFHPDDSPALAYRNVWNAINGAESWERNDWVWVVEFRRLSQ